MFIVDTVFWSYFQYPFSKLESDVTRVSRASFLAQFQVEQGTYLYSWVDGGVFDKARTTNSAVDMQVH